MIDATTQLEYYMALAKYLGLFTAGVTITMLVILATVLGVYLLPYVSVRQKD